MKSNSKQEDARPVNSGEASPARNSLLDTVFSILGSSDPDSPAVDVNTSGASNPVEEDGDVPWVLCIDDDQDFSEALKLRLEQHGVAVVRAFSGTEGVRMAFTSPADAIVLDYNMPNGQGDYVLDRLKNNPVTKGIPVIVVTGTQDKILERRMLSMGAAAFMNKPTNFDALRAQLAQHINILAAPEQRLAATE